MTMTVISDFALCTHADATDIVDSKLKLILGLVWHLILHYSISMPMWEGEEDYAPPKGTSDTGPTPKQRFARSSFVISPRTRKSQ